MPEDGKLKVDIPRRIVHRKSDETKCNDRGAVFAWIDLSSAVNLEGYGMWFPDWLIKESLEYCTLTIERAYKSGYTGKEVSNTFTVEHKEKIKGKRFKRFTYTPDELLELLQVYSEKVNKAKAAEQKQVFAKVTERTKDQQYVTFYAIGHINGRMFYSEDVEYFRNVHYSRDRQGGKQISAKSCQIIAEGLTEDNVKELRELIQAVEIARAELRELERDRSVNLPYPFGNLFPNCKEFEYGKEYLVTLHSTVYSRHIKGDHTTIKGYPDKLRAISAAFDEARAFLRSTIEEIEDRLDHYGAGEQQKQGGNADDF